MKTTTLFALPLILLSTLARAGEAPAPKAKRPTVAVLYFDTDSTEPDLVALRKGLAQMLITDLASTGGAVVVERSRLQEIMDELKLGQSTKLDQATTAKIGKLLGAHYQVVGGFFKLGQKLRVDARVNSVETGATVLTASANGALGDLLEMESSIASKLGEGIAKLAPAEAAAPPPKAEEAPKKPKKVSAKAVAAYSRALDAIDRKDKGTAKTELTEVLAEQPDFSYARIELASLMR